MGLTEVTPEVAWLRSRPIVMMSPAFVLDVVPLALASGTVSANQRVIGTGVLDGITAATVLTVFLVSVSFVVVRCVFKGNERQRRLDAAHEHGMAGSTA